MHFSIHIYVHKYSDTSNICKVIHLEFSTKNSQNNNVKHINSPSISFLIKFKIETSKISKMNERNMLEDAVHLGIPRITNQF